MKKKQELKLQTIKMKGLKLQILLKL